jgi:hypothetical protein
LASLSGANHWQTAADAQNNETVPVEKGNATTSTSDIVENSSNENNDLAVNIQQQSNNSHHQPEPSGTLNSSTNSQRVPLQQIDTNHESFTSPLTDNTRTSGGRVTENEPTR